MNCDEAREALEAYVAHDLDDATAEAVAEHLGGCSPCAAQHDRVRTLVGDLRELRDAYVPREVFDMSAIRNEVPTMRTRWGWRLATVAAVVLAALSLSVLTIPAVAETLKVLPVGERMQSLRTENEALRAAKGDLETQAKELEAKVEELQIKVKEIEGQKVPVVETAQPKLSAEVNSAVQSLAMRFINAQYAGDLKTLRELGTAKLQADLAKHPNDYIRKGGKVNFAQMTDVSMSGDTYLVFVRLMDANEWTDSQYQEDFEIKKVGDTYLVDFMGMDA